MFVSTENYKLSRKEIKERRMMKKDGISSIQQTLKLFPLFIISKRIVMNGSILSIITSDQSFYLLLLEIN